MRPLSTAVPALDALESAPDVVTPEWIQRRCGLTNRQALDAIRTAVRNGYLTWIERGKYRCPRTHVCIGA